MCVHTCVVYYSDETTGSLSNDSTGVLEKEQLDVELGSKMTNVVHFGKRKQIQMDYIDHKPLAQWDNNGNNRQFNLGQWWWLTLGVHLCCCCCCCI